MGINVFLHQANRRNKEIFSFIFPETEEEACYKIIDNKIIWFYRAYATGWIPEMREHFLGYILGTVWEQYQGEYIQLPDDWQRMTYAAQLDFVSPYADDYVQGIVAHDMRKIGRSIREKKPWLRWNNQIAK